MESAARDHGVHPSLLQSFIRKESAFDPDALSKAHAVGLMQLLPKTARAIRRETRQPKVRKLSRPTELNLFDPQANIDLGAWYVAALSQRFKGQLALGAAANNAGPRFMVGFNRWYVDADVL